MMKYTTLAKLFSTYSVDVAKNDEIHKTLCCVMLHRTDTGFTNAVRKFSITLNSHYEFDISILKYGVLVAPLIKWYEEGGRGFFYSHITLMHCIF